MLQADGRTEGRMDRQTETERHRRNVVPFSVPFDNLDFLLNVFLCACSLRWALCDQVSKRRSAVCQRSPPTVSLLAGGLGAHVTGLKGDTKSLEETGKALQ